MLKKVFHLLFTLCGMLLGLGVSQAITQKWVESSQIDTLTQWAFCGSAIFIFGIIFYTIYSSLGGRKKLSEYSMLPKVFSRVPVEEFVPGLVLLILGAFAATIISSFVMQIEALHAMGLNVIISILFYIGLSYYGWTTGRIFGRMNKDSIRGVFSADILKKKSKSNKNAVPKVFDTSVIIDGRIQGIIKSGFMEGEIIIPDFVMVELRHISDSADELKRQRGRRGLDILSEIEKEFGIKIYDTTSNKEIYKIPEVDLKLLKLAEILGGVVVTNDYNLGKVARVQNIGILNINELSNVLKPLALPGEIMRITPVKEGKNPDQSLAYLEDGTMIVVQGGRKLIGKTIDATVTSVLQTSAGRMIFVKP